MNTGRVSSHRHRLIGPEKDTRLQHNSEEDAYRRPPIFSAHLYAKGKQRIYRLRKIIYGKTSKITRIPLSNTRPSRKRVQ
ncbi:uncharacterized protein ARMOST_15952 [Armillaria ostoyae]|uniref:Uncharacterized protein n=1 Tax=Armillaria ostoyae TaxID=47428 RepID=A0A284RUY6_ARMOS|nr:uncharacterized protein ARMOST_15952 [Armillaria ostoyae]